jgi:hypothetical protein
VLQRERLGVAEQEILNQVGREVADVVLADLVLDETQLLKMASLRDLLVAEVVEQGVQVLVQRGCELGAEASPFVPDLAVAKPVLLDLWEAIPTVEEAGVDLSAVRNVSKKTDVPNDLVVQPAVLGLLAVEQQERIDEDREVIDQRYVERAVRIQQHRIDVKEVGEVDLH